MKTSLYIFGLILIVFAVILIVHTVEIEEKASSTIFTTNRSTSNVKLNENFSEGILNTQTWQITREGDFEESTVDVYDIDPTGAVDYRLRLRANTIGTSDDTVKFHGIRSVQKVDFSEELNISFDLDWNNQSNGCYLTGSIYLCPNATKENPRDETDWLKFEYIGVPPGQSARSAIATKIDGRTRWLYAEGWPEDRSGRKIADQHIRITLDDKSFKITEEGEEIYASSPHDLTFTSAYIYLQMSSHSNYPAREIYFDNVVVAEDISMRFNPPSPPAPDANGVETDTSSLRAERSGNEDGGVYEITFLDSDGIGEPAEGTVQIKVPHDWSGDCVSIDSGQNYDATAVN